MEGVDDLYEHQRGDRRALTLGVEPAESGVEAVQGLIRQSPHLAQRLTLGDPILAGDVGEQGTD